MNYRFNLLSLAIHIAISDMRTRALAEDSAAPSAQPTPAD